VDFGAVSVDVIVVPVFDVVVLAVVAVIAVEPVVGCVSCKFESFKFDNTGVGVDIYATDVLLGIVVLLGPFCTIVIVVGVVLTEMGTGELELLLKSDTGF